MSGYKSVVIEDRICFHSFFNNVFLLLKQKE